MDAQKVNSGSTASSRQYGSLHARYISDLELSFLTHKGFRVPR
jgi:hypothetical protein